MKCDKCGGDVGYVESNCWLNGKLGERCSNCMTPNQKKQIDASIMSGFSDCSIMLSCNEEEIKFFEVPKQEGKDERKILLCPL